MKIGMTVYLDDRGTAGVVEAIQDDQMLVRYTTTTGEGWWPVSEAAVDPRPITYRDPVPTKISRMQARVALLEAGLLENVDKMVSADVPAVREAWANASELYRDSPLVNQMANEFGLSEEVVDELFRQAARIVF